MKNSLSYYLSCQPPNFQIECIATVPKSTCPIVAMDHRSRKLMTPSATLYLYKSQAKRKNEAGATQSSLSSLDSVQKRLCFPVSDSSHFNLFLTDTPSQINPYLIDISMANIHMNPIL